MKKLMMVLALVMIAGSATAGNLTGEEQTPYKRICHYDNGNSFGVPPGSWCALNDGQGV